MKKTVSILLLLILSLTLFACKGNEEKTQLGTSDLYIAIPDGYKLTEDALDEDQIGYYYKDDNSIDFDVYQWAKGDEYTLESEAEYFASLYGTTPTEVEINGVRGMKYISVEEFDGEEYTVINYMFEDDHSIVEICFWTVNTAEEISFAEEIANTVTKK